MRVIFLDIDGVLDSAASSGRMWLVRLPRLDQPDKLTPVPPFDRECVARFNRLVGRTDANVVLSSTWGRVFDFDALKRYLADEGVVARIIGKTPVRQQCRPRGYDIQQWLDEWEGEVIEAFCIIDDHADMVHLKPQLVQTHVSVGLQDWDVDTACQLLSFLP